MSEQNPYAQLGVAKDASFEEIQEAKKKLSEQYREDSQTLQRIEAAYDAVIMDRLRMRQEGKIKVPEKIRFAETKPKTPPPAVKNIPNPSLNWLQDWLDTPTTSDILIPAAVFFGLSALAVFGNSNQGNILTLLLPLGMFANAYFFGRKARKVWRTILVTFGGLILGIALGAGLNSILVSQNINLFLNGDQLS
ncbi:MAG: molecular chaperone DnaJ, partial [Cyanobacteria bacterium J083]